MYARAYGINNFGGKDARAFHDKFCVLYGVLYPRFLRDNVKGKCIHILWYENDSSRKHTCVNEGISSDLSNSPFMFVVAG